MLKNILNPFIKQFFNSSNSNHTRLKLSLYLCTNDDVYDCFQYELDHTIAIIDRTGVTLSILTMKIWVIGKLRLLLTAVKKGRKIVVKVKGQKKVKNFEKLIEKILSYSVVNSVKSN